MALAGPKMHLIPAGFWARFWPLLQSASVEFYRDNCLEIAKAVAYSALLSFFPVVTAVAAILVQAQADAVSRAIAALLYEVVPPGTEDVVRTLFVVHGQRPRWLLVAATLLAAFAASGAMVSLMEGFRVIYRIPTGRTVIRERLVAILLVVIAVLPVLGASTLIVFGARTERMVSDWIPGVEFKGWVQLAGQVVRYSVAFGFFVLVVALVYTFGPNRKQQFGKTLPGAILATLLWMPTTIAFGWYVRYIADYNLLYGSVGAGLALLVWMYMLAVIMLLGCEFNSVRERV